MVLCAHLTRIKLDALSSGCFDILDDTLKPDSLRMDTVELRVLVCGQFSTEACLFRNSTHEVVDIAKAGSREELWGDLNSLE